MHYVTDMIEFPGAAAFTVVSLIDREIEALEKRRTKLRASRVNQFSKLNRLETQLRDLHAAREPLAKAERAHLDRIVEALS